MQKQAHIIGIIGGAGVAATNKLQELIEVELTRQGAFRDCHHPEMIIYQATQVPSRSMYLEGRGESFIPGYVQIAKKLKNCGATKLAMCCNTAHYAIDEITNQAGLPCINLVESVVNKALLMGVKSVGLMVSDGCLKGQIYESYFEKICPNVKILYPTCTYQQLVTRGICNIKNQHRFFVNNLNEHPSHIFSQVKKHLIARGADIVIIGCTDMRVAYYEEDNIDSLEVLKERIIEESFGNIKY